MGGRERMWTVVVAALFSVGVAASSELSNSAHAHAIEVNEDRLNAEVEAIFKGTVDGEAHSRSALVPDEASLAQVDAEWAVGLNPGEPHRRTTMVIDKHTTNLKTLVDKA